MKLLKINLVMFAFFCMVFGFSNCEGSKSKNSEIKLVQDPPFEIGEIYSQDWIAGIKGGGSGTNLYITFTELSEDIIIQNIFFKNNMVKAEASSQNRKQITGYFKNDINSDVIMDSDPVKESQNTPPIKIPFQLNEQDAVISYLYKGSLKYYMIVDIEEKPLIAYPTINRKNDQ